MRVNRERWLLEHRQSPSREGSMRSLSFETAEPPATPTAGRIGTGGWIVV